MMLMQSWIKHFLPNCLLLLASCIVQASSDGDVNSDTESDTAPQLIHIAYGDVPQNLVVVWSTKINVEGLVELFLPTSVTDTDAAQVGKETVITLENSAAALSYVHRVEVQSLTPGKRYMYRVVSKSTDAGNHNVFSQWFNVTVPVIDGTHTFLVIADMGLLSKALHFVTHEATSMKVHYDAVFHVGDIAYNLNTEEGAFGDRFLKRIQPMTSQIPYMTTPGDHESFDGFYQYTHRFSMPMSQWPMSRDSMWYSLDIGMTHFVSINTEDFYQQTSAQNLQRWLVNDLEHANNNRGKVPWIVVQGHKPIYCTRSVMEQSCDQEYSEVRHWLENVLFTQGVDLYISGHKHSYERTWPMYLNTPFQTDTVNPKAPIHIVIGSMGYEYLTDDQFNHPFWLAFAHSDRSKELYARLQVINATHMTWQVLVAKNNEEIEKVYIIQAHHGPFGLSGEGTLKNISFQHNRQELVEESDALPLPPEPLHILDEPMSGFARIRRLLLYSCVFSLSLCIAVMFYFIRYYYSRKRSRQQKYFT